MRTQPPISLGRASTLAASAWELVQHHMRRSCGVVMRDDQEYLLEARLGPVARRFAFASVSDFVQAALTGPGDAKLTDALVDAMTTHETLFFRDPTFWERIERVVLPALIARRRPVLRAWCAACSTGQEPYSLAILVRERFPQVFDRLEIVATDISAGVIETAREGVFSRLEVGRGLSPERLASHFETVPGGFRVKDSLRRPIQWRQHNLLGAGQDPGECDLVLCRNVLIYFEEHHRLAAIARLERAAVPGGFIGLGSTEMIGGRAIENGLYATPSGGTT